MNSDQHKLLVYYHITLCCCHLICEAHSWTHLALSHTHLSCHYWWKHTKIIYSNNNKLFIHACHVNIHEHIKSGVLRAGSVASSRQTVHVCVCRWVCVGEEGKGGSRKLLEGSDVGYWVAEYAGARRSLAAHWLTRCRKARERETLRLHLKRSWPIAMLQSSCWLNCWHTAISPSLWVSADSQKSGLHGRGPDILLMTNYTHFFSKRKLDNWKRLLWKLEQLRFASTASRSRQL